jgi:uncharacterized protein
LTFACNLACDYCYVKLASREVLSLDMAFQAVDLALGSLDPGGVLELAFFGGEPLLESDLLLEILKEARERAGREDKQVAPSVTSNGTLLSPVTLGRLLEAGIRLTVSCDGVAASHDQHRPFRSGAGSFQKVRQGLIQALKMGLDPAVNMVVTPENVSRLAVGVEELVALGVQQIVMSPDYDASWEEGTLEVMATQYHTLGDIYARKVLEGSPLALSFVEEKIQRSVRGGTRAGDRCAFGQGELAVDPRGRLFPCERLVRDRGGDESVVGQLPEGVDPQRLQALRGSLGTPASDCLDCGIRPLCTHWCACVNLSRTGKAGEPDGFVCFHENLAIEVTEAVTKQLYPSLFYSPGGSS